MGVAIAGILIILAVGWAFIATRRLKRLQQTERGEQGYGSVLLGGKAEKDGNEKQVYRNDGKDLRSELGTYESSNLPELDAQGRGRLSELGP